jgi:hypothetical protein
MKRFFIVFLDFLNAVWLLFLTGVWIAIASKIIDFSTIVSYLSNNIYIFLGALFVAIVVIPIIFFTYVHYLFWGIWKKQNSNFPIWLATMPSWDEGTWQWSIAFTANAVMAVLMGIIIFFFDSNLPPDLSDYEVKYRLKELGEKIIPFFTIIWLVIATSMLKGKRKWAERKMKKKAQNQTPQQSAQAELITKIQSEVKPPRPSTIDDELGRLKSQIEEEKKNP